MLPDTLRRPAVSSRLLAPVEARFAPLFCLLLLTAASVLASFALACATPLAAFAAVAAAMLPLSAALPVVAAVWIVNQAIGFGALGYPMEPNTFLWGLALGAAALIAAAAAAPARRLAPTLGRPAALGLGLAAAYAAYEIVLFAFTPALGDAGAFTATIVARLFLLNVLWMIGLVAVCEIVPLLTAARQRRTFT